MSKKKGIFSSLFGGKKPGGCCDMGIIDDTIENAGCSCTDGCCNPEEANAPIGENAVNIKILGSGCKNCITLTENTKLAISQMKLQANIEKVSDLSAITGYGVMSTPALVVNEKVVSYGKVLKANEIVKILEKMR